MNKKIDNYIINEFSKSKLFYIIISYLLFGTICFVSMNTQKNYIEIFDSVLINRTFICLFILPSFMIFSINLYGNIANNKQIISRLNTRKEYFYLQLRVILKCTSIMYLLLLVIIIINVNIKQDNIFYIGESNIIAGLNIVVLLVDTFKIFCTILTLQLLNYICISKYNNKIIFSTLLFIVLMIIFISQKYEAGIKTIYLPSLHIYSHSVYSNIIESFMYSFIYYTILNILFIYIFKKHIMKSDILGDKQI